MEANTRARPRYESLDHWRGLACILVVIYHSTLVYLSTGRGFSERNAATWLIAQTNTFNVGVALFFVISGYCISAASDSVRRKGHGVRDYFLRRFRRIYPPFWIIVACSVLFFFLVDLWPVRGLISSQPWAQLRPWWYSGSQWFGNLTLTETWRHHVFGSQRGHFPGQAWTLCYEEQFYFVMGLLVAFVPSNFFAGVMGVTILTLATMFASAASPDIIQGFFLDGSWLLFAAGVVAYFRVNYLRGWRRYAADIGLLAAVPAALFITLPIYGSTVGFLFAAMLPWLHRFDQQIATSWIASPFRRPGQMCYSLYLVHQLPVKAISAALYGSGVIGAWPTVFVTIPASVAVSIGLGWLFYVSVERRFLNRPYADRLSEEARVPMRSIGAVIGPG